MSTSLCSRRRAIATTLALSLPLLTSGARAQPAGASFLSGSDVSGKPISLRDVAGRVVLVSFLTGDCAVCTNELKLLREFHAANRARGFALLVVSLDKRASDYRQLASYMLSVVPAGERFPLVWRNDPAHRDSFGEVLRNPTHVVLDRQATEVRRRAGAMQPGDWDDLWSLI